MKKIYILLLLVLTGTVANATTKTWTNALGGSWNTPGNWDNGVPVSGDDVIFNNGTGQTITANLTIVIDVATININSLTLTGSASVTFQSPISTVYTINLGINGSGSGVALAHNTAGKNFSLTAGGTASGTGGGGFIINIPTGYTASIGGTFTMTNSFGCSGSGTGCNTNATTGRPNLTAQLIGQDAGSIVFNSGSICSMNFSLFVSPFYNGSNNAKEIVVFKNGSFINHNSFYSSNIFFGQAYPNPTVKIETGNKYTFNGYQNTSQTIDVTGRTYSHLVFNASGASTGSGSTFTLQNNSLSTVTNPTLASTKIDSLILSAAPLVVLTTSTGTQNLDSTYIIGNISLGQSGTGATNSLRIQGSTGKPVTCSVSGNILIGSNNGFVNTNTITFGPAAGGTQNTATINFSSTGKSLSFGTSGTNTFNTQNTPATGVTCNVNYIVTSGANFTFNRPLTLSTGTAPITNTSMVVNAGGTLVVGSAGSIAAGGRLTIKSDTTGTGAIGNSVGAITGNVIVERFIPSLNRKKYTMVGSPVTSTINAGWQEGATGGTFVGVPSGYGTSITGGVAQGTSGFDGPSSSSTSIYTYNDNAASGSKWTAITNTTTATLAPGTGYFMFVRGDRKENRAVTGTSSNTTLRATGAVGQGSVSPTLLATSDKFTLIANPYPSAIDWNSVGITKTNLTSIFYVYDPNLGVFVSSNGSAVTPLSGTGTSQQQAAYIQSGQAFFVQNTAAGSGAITFTEAAKTTVATTSSSTTVFGDNEDKAQLKINTYRTVGNVFADGTVALFGKLYNNAVDNKHNINKFTNFNETFSLRRNNQALGLEARSTITANDTLFIGMSNFGKRDYSLVIDGSNFKNVTAKLEDSYTGSKTDLDLTATNTYNFTVNTDAASASNDRFIITLGSTAPATVIADATAATGLFVKMSPNPVSNQLQVSFRNATTAPTTINVINTLGQIVKTINAGNVDSGNLSIPVSNLSSGTYTVQLISGSKQISTQKVVKQ